MTIPNDIIPSHEMAHEIPARDARSRTMSERLRNDATARVPALGWSTFTGPRDARVPSIFDAPQVLFTTSGRAAIMHALHLLGVKPGDRVLVPTYHCPTMIAPVVLLGARPLFYPITDSGAPDLDFVTAQDLRGVRAMLVAHYFGLVQSLAATRELCNAHNIALVEDCAHAFFGEVDGRPVGQWGDLAIASLTKFFPVSEGGCLVASSRALEMPSLRPRRVIEEVKSFADAVELGARYRGFPGINGLLRGVFGLKNVLRGRRRDAALNDADETIEPASATEVDVSAVNARLTTASRWLVGASHCDRIVTLRRRNYELLARMLSGIAEAEPYRVRLPDASAPYVFPLRVQRPAARYRAMREARVPIFRWDRIWPGTPAIPGDAGAVWATEMFQLACHQDLDEQDIEAIAQSVRRIVREVR